MEVILECHSCEARFSYPRHTCPECGASWVSALVGGLSGAVSPSHWLVDKQSQQHQQNAEEDFAKHQVQWRKQDLINSGFNPLLAVGEGATMGGVSSAGHTASVGSGAMEGMLGERRQNLASAMGIAQAENLRADAELKRQQARGAKIDADMKYGATGSEIERNRAAAGQSGAETRVLEDTRREIDKRIQNIDADTQLKGRENDLKQVQTAIERIDVKRQLEILPDIIASMRQQGSAGRALEDDGSLLNAIFRWLVDHLNALRGAASTTSSAAGAAAALAK